MSFTLGAADDLYGRRWLHPVLGGVGYVVASNGTKGYA